VIGFGTGLPAKIDVGGAVVDTRSTSLDYFVATLDTFGGNSGSGVFVEVGGNVVHVGVLVRGAQDYAFDETQGCNAVNVIAGCSIGMGCGEDSTYSYHAEDLLTHCQFNEDCSTGSVCYYGVCHDTPMPTPTPTPTPTSTPTSTPFPENAIQCFQWISGNTLDGENNIPAAFSHDGFLFFDTPEREYQFLSTGQYVRFSTCNSEIDTVLTVFDAFETIIAQSDDSSCGLQSIIDAYFPPGEYSIVVEGFGEAVGQFTLHASCHPQLYQPETITCGSVVTGSTVGAENVLQNPSGDAFYSVHVESEMQIFDTCGSNYDSYLHIYDLDMNVVAATDDDGPCGLAAQLITSLSEGYYYVQVDGFQALEGQFTLRFECGPYFDETNLPGNDDDEDDNFPIHGCGSVVYDTTAGRENILPQQSFNEFHFFDGAEYIFQFESDGYHMIELSTCGSQIDTVLSIFEEEGPLYQNDDSPRCGTGSYLAVLLPPGTYFGVIEGLNGAEGDFTLKINCGMALHCGDFAEGDTSSGTNNYGNTAAEAIAFVNVQPNQEMIIADCYTANFDAVLRSYDHNSNEVYTCYDCCTRFSTKEEVELANQKKEKKDLSQKYGWFSLPAGNYTSIIESATGEGGGYFQFSFLCRSHDYPSNCVGQPKLPLQSFVEALNSAPTHHVCSEHPTFD
jgi:hypothetical protein